MKIISVFNQKGGVGKTTSVINIAKAISELGDRVLVVDMDPQANTSTGFGVDKNSSYKSIYDLFYKLDIFTEEDESSKEASEDIIKEDKESREVEKKEAEQIDLSQYYMKVGDKLDLIPSQNSLSGLEVELVGLDESKRLTCLREILAKLKDSYDYVLIDCPPSLGLLSINALVASTDILIPIQSEYYALEGVTELMNTYKLIKSSINKDLSILGVFLVMFNKDENLSIEVLEEVKDYFKEKTLEVMIPRDVRLAEAPSFGKSIFDYDRNSKAAEAYKMLAEKIRIRANDK